jgi:hypothetical protein
MLTYEACIQIDAPAEKVWSVLVDVAHWNEWDPSCERIEGSVALGSTVKAYTKMAPGRAFSVTVAELDAPRKMTWAGGLPLGLFKGTRTFTLTPKGEGVEVHVKEAFTGPMAKLVGKSIPDMTEPFNQFCAGLKQRSER